MVEHMWSVGDILRPRDSEPVQVIEVKKGGWGIVYIAENQHTGQRQAIKTLQDRFVKNELAVRRFIQEAHLWIRLGSNPHIVRAHFADTIYGRPCLFMEYVDGGSLRSWLAQGSLPVEQTLDFALQLARGMRFVWQTKQLVHRDLKPENLMLTRTGQLKVTDFGLAHALGIAGTPLYMAPEQFRSVRVETQADVYAFGLILFEMLTGQVPHLSMRLGRLGQRELDTLIERRSHEPVPDPRRWSPTIPGPVVRLLLDCLMVKSGLRPADFEVVCQRLEPFATRLHPVETGGVPGLPHHLVDNLMGTGAARALVLSTQGASLANLGRFEEALSLYDQALSANDQISEIWKNRSTALLGLGRYEEALACSERALALGPQTARIAGEKTARHIDLMSWTNKTSALAEMGRHQEALAACEEALRLDSTYPRLWNNKGAILIALDQLDEALICIKRAIELDPVYEKAWSLKGQIQARRGDLEGALAAFEALLSINPRNVDGLAGKAQCLLALGCIDEAEGWFSTAEGIDPRAYRLFLKQSLNLASKATAGRDEAASLAELLAMGSLSEESGDYQQAAEYYEQAIQADPTCADAWNNKGNCLYELGERTAAVSCLQRTLELDPDHPYALLNLSRFCLDSGDLSRARQFAERAIRSDPRNDLAWNNRGAALYRLGQIEEATKSINRAIELNPNNALAWANLGTCRLSLDDRSGAETCLLEALALNPDLESAQQMLKHCH